MASVLTTLVIFSFKKFGTLDFVSQTNIFDPERQVAQPFEKIRVDTFASKKQTLNLTKKPENLKEPFTSFAIKTSSGKSPEEIIGIFVKTKFNAFYRNTLATHILQF